MLIKPGNMPRTRSTFMMGFRRRNRSLESAYDTIKINSVVSAHEHAATTIVFFSHSENEVSVNNLLKLPKPSRRLSGNNLLMMPVSGVTRNAVYKR